MAQKAFIPAESELWVCENPDDESDAPGYKIVTAPTSELAAIESGWPSGRVFKLVPTDDKGNVAGSFGFTERLTLCEFDIE